MRFLRYLPNKISIPLLLIRNRLKLLFPPSQKQIEEMKAEFADFEAASLSDMNAFEEKYIKITARDASKS